MSELPKHLREKVDQEICGGLYDQCPAEALWKILSEVSADEEKAIKEAAFNHVAYVGAVVTVIKEMHFIDGARFGLALGRVKAESEK